MAWAMIISLFPFAAFANSTVDSTDSLKTAIENASAGDTITISAGTYDIGSLTIDKPVNLVGAEGEKVTLKGSILYKSFTGDNANKTINIENITFEGTESNSLQGICLSTGVSGYELNISNCAFNNWKYALTMNSGAADNTLNVNQTTFENTGCAVSVKEGNKVGFYTDVKQDSGYAVQYFNSGITVNGYYNTMDTSLAQQNNNNLSFTPDVDVTADSNQKVVFDENELQKAVNASTNGTKITIAIGKDIALTQPISLSSNQKVEINGNGHSITYSFDGFTGVKEAFKIADSNSEMAGTPTGVTLIINGVSFENINNATPAGYAVLVGANAQNDSVSLDQCLFTNLYCGILANPVTDQTTNAPTLSITNSNFTNTTYGYSIDESTPGALVDAVKPTFTNNGEVTESEPWPNVQAYVTHGGLTTVASSFADAVTNAQSGDVITLAKNLESTDKITLRAGVTLDGNGHSLTYTGSDQEQAFITADSGQDNVTIKNITINAKNIKHGVQFYCNKGGTLEKAVVNGGTYTSVIVNGATNVSIVDSDLNPAAGAYTNIEYAMGQNVTTIPSMSVDNVSFGSAKSYVYADDKTTTAVKNTMGGNPSNEEILDKILKNIVYTNPNGGNLNIVALFAGAGQEGTSSLTGSVESTYQPPYTGKYSYAINVADTDNGSVSVDKYATEGEKVTLTVSPDKAYKLDELTVTAGGKDVELTDNGDGTYTFTMPSSKVQISATFVEDENYEEPTPEEPSSDMPFGDVNTGDWFYDVVKYAYDNGLMTGTSATTFEPNTTTTRGMIVAILNRLEGNPTAADAGFADVNSGDWYADAVNWAASVGIVNGYSDTQFGPNDPITREQMAAILYNYAEYKGYDVSARADISSYDDAANVSDWAIESVQWANAMGLVNGMTDTTLDPQGNATRAQIAAILSRYLTGING